MTTASSWGGRCATIVDMSAPAPLDRDRIVAAAVTMLERDGVAGLSMRKLAAELGTKPMSIYHHVPNKSALLSLALSEIAAHIPWEPPTGAPRERMIHIAMDMYLKLTDIPWIVAILREGTNVGTPALALADQFITAANELGLDDQHALNLWCGVWYLVSSELQWHDSVAHRTDEQRSWFETMDPDSVAALPAVARILPDWREYSAGFDLREAITAQIDGAITSQ